MRPFKALSHLQNQRQHRLQSKRLSRNLKSTVGVPMKINVSIVCLAITLLTTGLMTGCGDSDDDSSSGSAPSVSIFAGQINTPGSAGGSVNGAQFDAPMGLAADQSGNIYVADENAETISKISNGSVSILAGTPYQQGSSDGAGSAARFESPQELAIDPSGNLYMTDDVPNSDAEIVRKITPAGQVSTIINPATGQALQTNGSTAIAADAQSNVYIFTTNETTGAVQLTQITPAGAVNPVALTSISAAPVLLINPQALAVDASNNLYISDNDINAEAGALYKVSLNGSAGQATLLAGSVVSSGSSDGTGSLATFNGLDDLAIDSGGNVYAEDYYNGTIREITPGGVVTTFAGVAGQPGLFLGQLPLPLPLLDGLAIVGSTLYMSATINSVVLQIAPL
ncbi:DUF839 domain-containing protein [Caballeronia sp. LZ065]|uniref:alkaline phosphatase PhoX n=1 Tax=Caballeronia sp. LZ065 TaxID=3038571 RepID=UPI00285943F8|nr:alkaline phosphatase PhoX [Caballeronia sp. LZ065]MDR5782618.1 DUF839 domain-containing protein [Caballeronia sp. LZ065]